MIKNVEIEMYGHKWLIEIDQYSDDEFDFDINHVELNHNGVTLDMSDLADNYKELDLDFGSFVSKKLKQEVLNNV